MRKFRGFRLGPKLVRVSRWVFRRRPKHGAYLRLSPTPPSPTTRTNHMGSTPTLARIVDWGRCLTRRLCTSSRLVGGGGYYRLPSDGDHNHHHLLPLENHVSKPPKGHLAVYVGGKGVDDPPHRYVVPVIYFNHPLFGELLREAEQEYGFEHTGGITIPCPVSDFESVQTQIAAHCPRSARMRLWS